MKITFNISVDELKSLFFESGKSYDQESMSDKEERFTRFLNFIKQNEEKEAQKHPSDGKRSTNFLQQINSSTGQI
jgi:hypothetical protein